MDGPDAGAETLCDYVVVGSGAGGGVLAARLAEAGYHVVLLEAGGDPRKAATKDGRSGADDYDVPAFHPFSSEETSISWPFFVRHYEDDAAQRKDPAYRDIWRGRKVDGVLYPRASCLGGCTAHNAMIFITPPDSDWDALAARTGDASWGAAQMSGYLKRIERCRHRWLSHVMAAFGLDGTGHGWHGWLTTQKALPWQALFDVQLVRVVVATAAAALRRPGRFRPWLTALFNSFGDPNDRSVLRDADEGLFYTPLTTRRHARHGVRERVLAVAARPELRLEIRLHALVTRVLLDERKRAFGVAYLSGENIYDLPAPAPVSAVAQAGRIRVRKEVILAGGTFNTPQLLMLSGIGPREALARLEIDTVVDLPGVGRHLQDRYEVGVVNRMAHDFKSLKGAKFTERDMFYRLWRWSRRGMYISNGSCVTAVSRSARDKDVPDLFCMALLAQFDGYYPGYSRNVAKRDDCLTWCILKAHTINRAGVVSLVSKDPRVPPRIVFHYFREGDDKAGEDLRAVVEGIRFVRDMTKDLRASGVIAAEEQPGPAVQSQADLETYVRNHAWGHHACGTCAIGPLSEMGVLDSEFRVHGVDGLRVVDASVFPRIPGFFIAGAVYMIAEKAADVIIAA